MAEEAVGNLNDVFSNKTVDRHRAETGFNPRKRTATASMLLLVIVEAFLSGIALGFNAMRAFFVRRFGPIRSRAIQLRFKSAIAKALFKAALDHLEAVTCSEEGLQHQGAMAAFDDVHVFDGTVPRVHPRGPKNATLKGCTKRKAGSKWVVSYSLRTNVAFAAAGADETASELTHWRRVAPTMRLKVLYLLDLGFFSKELYSEAQRVNAHLLMRLKSSAKVHVRAKLKDERMIPLHDRFLAYYLNFITRRLGTVLDLDVIWVRGSRALSLRLVGNALGGKKGCRFYLSTVSRDVLSAAQIIESYRLRWLRELPFRE